MRILLGTRTRLLTSGFRYNNGLLVVLSLACSENLVVVIVIKVFRLLGNSWREILRGHRAAKVTKTY